MESQIFDDIILFKMGEKHDKINKCGIWKWPFWGGGLQAFFIIPIYTIAIYFYYDTYKSIIALSSTASRFMVIVNFSLVCATIGVFFFGIILGQVKKRVIDEIKNFKTNFIANSMRNFQNDTQ